MPARGNEATGWGQSKWGTSTAVFTRPSTGAHSGTHSLRVDVSGYTEGDAKWSHTPVSVTGGKYYTVLRLVQVERRHRRVDVLADRRPGNTRAGRQLRRRRPADVRHVVEPRDRHRAGVGLDASSSPASTCPPAPCRRPSCTSSRATASCRPTTTRSSSSSSPLGFKRPLVSLTFDDSTPNLYNYVIPELDKLGYKSTQYVVTGATGARDDAGVLYQWSASQIKDVHQRGHEIGSHTEYHPNLAMPGPKAVCRSAGDSSDVHGRARGRVSPPVGRRRPRTEAGSTRSGEPTCGCARRRSVRRPRTWPTPPWPRSWVTRSGSWRTTSATACPPSPTPSVRTTRPSSPRRRRAVTRPAARSTRATTPRSASIRSRSRSRTSSRPSARRTAW